MQYRSTNGTAHFEGTSFEDTLFGGYLPDGGLFMPETIPKLTAAQLKVWSTLSYQELCLELLMMFIGEDFIERNQLKKIISQCYSAFPAEVVPFKELHPNTFVAELFHGPTLAFKDLPMVMAAALLDFALERKQKRALVYVATSGDTGSAAIHATKNSKNIDTLVLLPGGGRISNVQRLQMTTVPNENIHSFAGECFCNTFDEFLLDFVPKITKGYPDIIVTSLNSMLWIRILAQTVHLVYCYFRTAKDLGPVNFVVPTGGAGHLSCALMMQNMGFPISLYPAFNDKNLNLYNLLTGKEMKYKGEAVKSLSVAMDLFYAPNVYRLLYLWSGLNCDVVKSHMEDYNNGGMKLSPALLNKVQQSITPLLCSDDDIKETISNCWKDKSYILDPHTSSGYTHYYKQSFDSKNSPSVYMACASPAKFSETLQLCDIPFPKEYNSFYEELKGKNEHCKDLPEDPKQWETFLLPYVAKVVKKSK